MDFQNKLLFCKADIEFSDTHQNRIQICESLFTGERNSFVRKQTRFGNLSIAKENVEIQSKSSDRLNFDVFTSAYSRRRFLWC